MLVALYRKTLDPSKFRGELVFLVSSGFVEKDPRCGVFSGRGLDVEWSNQSMPKQEIPGDQSHFYCRAVSPTQTERSMVYHYHYVAVEWYDSGAITYHRPTEFSMENNGGNWSLHIWGMTIDLPDYEPGKVRSTAPSALQRLEEDFL